MKWREQARVLRLGPGATSTPSSSGYGRIDSPEHLRRRADGPPRDVANPARVRICSHAGLLPEVEGYVEPSRFRADRRPKRRRARPRRRAFGAPADDGRRRARLLTFAHADARNYQPTNITFGIIEPLPDAPRKKHERNLALSARALADLLAYAEWA